MLVNIVRWRIPKEYSARQLEVWAEMMDYQRAHPEKVFYIRSCFYTSSPEGASEEEWMFLDEYEHREDFDRWMKAVREDPDLMALMERWFPKWDALVVPESKKSEFWAEVESLRVEP
jgi:nicotinamidase-related amidase